MPRRAVPGRGGRSTSHFDLNSPYGFPTYSLFNGVLSMASFFRRKGRKVTKVNTKTRLSLDALETRECPATFTVNTLTDDNTAANGVLSLREAITAANGMAGADNIIFQND